jgi:hypothetical protein
MTMAFTFLRRLFGRAEAPKPQNVSPQGWSDQNPAWPPSGKSVHYPTPWSAVDAVEGALADLKTLSDRRSVNAQHDDLGSIRYQLALEQFVSALQTLSMAAKEIVSRKGTFGRLTHVLATRLPALSHLIQNTHFNFGVYRLTQDLKQCVDADLAQKGKELEESLHLLSANAA